MFGRILVGLVSVLGLACQGTAPLPRKAVELNNHGVEALAKGDLDVASARFQLALEYHPHFVDALTNQGLVELQRGNFAQARELLERARRLNPHVAQPHHALGVLAERSQRADLASEHYRAALRVDPGFAPSRANLARLLFNAGMMEDAREQYLRLVEVSPGDASGYQGLAESLLRLGRLEEADAVLARGLGRVPNSPELRVLEGRRFIRGGQYERAVSNLAPLVTGNDGPAVSALSWTAVAQLALGELREARAASLRAVELDPFDPVAVYTLALVLTRLRDPVAGTWAERARRLFAHDLPALQALELARTAAAGERENKKRKSAH